MWGQVVSVYKHHTKIKNHCRNGYHFMPNTKINAPMTLYNYSLCIISKFRVVGFIYRQGSFPLKQLESIDHLQLWICGSCEFRNFNTLLLIVALQPCVTYYVNCLSTSPYVRILYKDEILTLLTATPPAATSHPRNLAIDEKGEYYVGILLCQCL